MAEKKSHDNYLFVIIKLILVFFVLCFLIELGKQFLHGVNAQPDLNINVLVIAALVVFVFYTFIADLNNIYKTIQGFFFHSSTTIFVLIFPALFVLAGLIYFLVFNIFNVHANKDLFLFLGGVLATIHVIFIAREKKGNTFPAFVHYLFIFSIIFAIQLVLFTVYLRIAFKIPVNEILIDGSKQGVLIIKNIFTHTFK